MFYHLKMGSKIRQIVSNFKSIKKKDTLFNTRGILGYYGWFIIKKGIRERNRRFN
jgi:hypothetical protein